MNREPHKEGGMKITCAALLFAVAPLVVVPPAGRGRR
jgi:hypothetical protein